MSQKQAQINFPNPSQVEFVRGGARLRFEFLTESQKSLIIMFLDNNEDSILGNSIFNCVQAGLWYCEIGIRAESFMYQTYKDAEEKKLLS